MDTTTKPDTCTDCGSDDLTQVDTEAVCNDCGHREAR